MTWNVLYMIILLFAPTVSAVVQLSIITEVAANIQVQVLWKREDGDPRVWDLRLAMDGQDKGVPTTVQAGDNLRGVASVIFPEVGQFTLQAINPNDNQPIASINGIQVGDSPVLPSSSPSTSSPSSSPFSVRSTTSISSSSTPTSSSATPSPTSSTISSSTSPASSTPASGTPSSTPSHHASSMTPAIIGGVIGGVVFLAIIAILAIVFHRRRQRATRRITFDRDLMVQHRDALPPPNNDVERAAGRMVV